MARTFLKATSDYLTAAEAGVTGAPLTMACFIRVNVMQFHAAMSLDNGGSHAYFLGVNNAGQAQAQVNAPGGGGFSQAASSSVISANSWHYMAAVYRSTAYREAYVDGGGKGIDTTPVTPAAMSRTELGRIAGFVTFLDGALAEAAIWSAALSDTEIRRLATGASPLTVRAGSLVFYAPLVAAEDFDVVGGLRLAAGSGQPGVTGHANIIHSAATALRAPGRVVANAQRIGEHARRRLLAATAGAPPTLRAVMLDDALIRVPA